MINVIPNDLKSELKYARRNAMLLSWILAMMAGLAGIGIIVAAGYIYINQATGLYEKEVTQAKSSLSSQKLEETQKRVEDISSSTKLAVQVLEKQVIFSGFLEHISTLIPTGARLESLAITKVDGALDLQFAAKNAQAATQTHVNLSDPGNELFDKADMVSFNCPEEVPLSSNRYPCQVTIRALLGKNNPYLFVKNKTGAKNE